VLLVGIGACGKHQPSTTELLQPNSGGALTVDDQERRAFTQPAPNLNMRQRAAFFTGIAFFNSPWIVAPATARARDGLGPLFNASSCDACHNGAGRGRPPEQPGERPVSLVMQFGSSTSGPHGEPVGDPRYGGALNPFSIDGVPAEGTVRIEHRDIHGQFADGEPYTLSAPTYHFEQLAYGALPPDTIFSPRIAPAIFGSGLLDAIPEAQILERADPHDSDGDGIAGRPNRVWDRAVKRTVIGRLGWKANQPDVAHQTAAAFSSEIGMTTTLLPQETCTEAQTECRAAPNGGSPEIDDKTFQHIVDYQQMLGVPKRRDLDSPEVKQGAQLFITAGCEACHRASFITGEIPGQPWLSKQRIHPFSDLLLHDMGPGLADGRRDFEASGSQWRTQPLWGLGLLATVNGHTRLLHDGRARNVNEAILWHGGEAQRAQQSYVKMSKAEREALLRFIDSL